MFYNICTNKFLIFVTISYRHMWYNEKNVDRGILYMSKKVEFYTVSVKQNNVVTDYAVSDFFENLNPFFEKSKKVNIDRKIGEKYIRLFSYYYSLNHHQMVIPFGKFKDKNKPYWLINNEHLEEVPADLYDINSLAYDIDYNVMLFTTNKEGPSVRNVEEYLNTFIPTNTGLSLEINPIVYNAGIEKVRTAELVREITLDLDLGRALNNFYKQEIRENTERGLIDAFRKFAVSAKDDADGRTLSLKLGLGKYAKKYDTLNICSMLQLLEYINIGEDFVREITVHYKDGKDEKIDKARLKDSNMLLSFLCKSRESQISPKRLLENINDAIAEKVIIITRHNDEYFANRISYNGGPFEIVANWDSN